LANGSLSLQISGAKYNFFPLSLLNKLFDPSTHKVFASRDVIFHEQAEGNNEDNSHEGWHVLLEDEEVKEEKQQQEKAPSDMDTSSSEEESSQNQRGL
jgi:hypothetical protein